MNAIGIGKDQDAVPRPHKPRQSQAGARAKRRGVAANEAGGHLVADGPVAAESFLPPTLCLRHCGELPVIALRVRAVGRDLRVPLLLQGSVVPEYLPAGPCRGALAEVEPPL